MEKLKIGDRFDMYESLPSIYLNYTFPAGMQRLHSNNSGVMKSFLVWDSFGQRRYIFMDHYEVKKIGTWVVKRLSNNDPITII